jgi:hypothetical protein
MSEVNEVPWPKIELTDSVADVVVKMSQGNPGAISVMAQIIDGDAAKGLFDLLNMDDMGMRGPAIWIGYKDHCGEDIERFRLAVRSRDADMVATIQRQGYNVARNRFERK